MIKRLPILFLGLVGFLFFPRIAFAQVVINEFSSATSSDWIELFSSEDVDISGWILDNDGTLSSMKTIPGGTIIGPSYTMYYVVEVSNRLNKNGDIISLFDIGSDLKDQISYGDKGGVCLPSEAGSIGRYPDANSTIERFSSHTKANSNNSGSLDPCPTPTPTPKPTVKAAATKRPIKLTFDTDSEDSILGLREGLAPSPTGTPEPDAKSKFPWSSLFFILGGIGFMGFAGFSFLKQRQKGYNNGDGDGKKTKGFEKINQDN